MPSKLQYVTALESLVRRGLHPRKRDMLLFHRAAPRQTVTMSMLAEHVGYRSFSPANLHYGRLGADLARLGEFSFPDRRFAISAIGRWGHLPPHPSGHFSFRMHPELVAALADVFGPVTRGRKGKRDKGPAGNVD